MATARGGADRFWWGLALVCAAPAFCFPLFNPDLFWHLSAGRWILEHLALPREDFLSFTKAGRPWVDFEWLAQLVYQGVYACGGMLGLWYLKLSLLVVSWLPLLRLLRSRGVAEGLLPAALAIWAVNVLAYSDIRSDLFSLLLFSWLLLHLESGSPLSWTWRRLLGVGAWFAVWADLHAGFALGLALLLCYAACAALRRDWPQARAHAAALAAGALGSLCNPYGWGPHRVLWEHWSMIGHLERNIVEWSPMNVLQTAYWPFWPTAGALVAVTAAALWRRRQDRSPSLALPAFAILLCLAALRHQRSSLLFTPAAVAAIFLTAREAGWDGSAWLRRAAACVLVLGAVFSVWLLPRIFWGRGVFNYLYVPYSAAEFMAPHRRVFAGLRLYNAWAWGGYLGWRLRPWYRPFCDGRYIFHDQLARVQEAFASPELWGAFMERERLDGALMLNYGVTLAGRRPWYDSYMPPRRWAVVYWDDAAILFVARRAVPPDWLAAHEYRFLLPWDDARLAEALRRKQVPVAAAAEELRRHQEELRVLQ
ncbi:MAG: hypothetical protein PHU21_05660 [Elusimicrobia bacterium]|nr:hypothetical protein [Elusimicrobiota bacterium]